MWLARRVGDAPGEQMQLGYVPGSRAAVYFQPKREERTRMAVQPTVYKDFPARIVLYRAPLLVATVVLGGITSLSIGILGLMGFIACALVAILWTMRHACRNCAYHGRRCDLGVSLLATVLHPVPGSPKAFPRSAKIAVGLLAVMLAVPFALGIGSLIGAYSTGKLWWFGIYAVAVVAVIWTTALSCPHCAMRRICPISFYRANGGSAGPTGVRPCS
jgi:hypothetical protein